MDQETRRTLAILSMTLEKAIKSDPGNAPFGSLGFDHRDMGILFKRRGKAYKLILQETNDYLEEIAHCPRCGHTEIWEQNEVVIEYRVSSWADSMPSEYDCNREFDGEVFNDDPYCCGHCSMLFSDPEFESEFREKVANLPLATLNDMFAGEPLKWKRAILWEQINLDGEDCLEEEDFDEL